MTIPTITMIPTRMIRAGNNDRKQFDQAALSDLANSIRENGLKQPPTVRRVHDGYEIICGERRTRACLLLDWEEIPAIVEEMTDEQASAVMLLENTARVDLNPMEEARAYQSRIDRYEWPVAKVAQLAGVSESRVKSRLLLLTLSPEIQILVQSGQLPIGHAELLAKLDRNRQVIACRILNGNPGMGIVRFREIVNELRGEQDKEVADMSALFQLEAQITAQVAEESSIGAGIPIRQARKLAGILKSGRQGYQHAAQVIDVLYPADEIRNRLKLFRAAHDLAGLPVPTDDELSAYLGLAEMQNDAPLN